MILIFVLDDENHNLNRLLKLYLHCEKIFRHIIPFHLPVFYNRVTSVVENAFAC